MKCFTLSIESIQYLTNNLLLCSISLVFTLIQVTLTIYYLQIVYFIIISTILYANGLNSA